MAKSIKVFAPATVANVACGFDVLGFAVNEPGDEVILTLSDKPGVRIKSISGDEGRLPMEADRNTVSISILNYLDKLGIQQGVEIDLIKKMPLGSGLGSSAASTVAGVYAINELLDKPMAVKDLLPFAMEGERIASGSAHADNVAPCLLGGFVLVRSYSPLDVIKLPVPKNLYATIVHPHVEVQTRDARNILRKQVELSDAVTQWGNVGGLVAGLLMEDIALIGRSLQDVIVEPVRSVLIPGFDDVKQAAMEAGALGGSISGSGPSVFALSTSLEVAKKIGKAMYDAFAQYKIESDVFVSPINPEGPKVIG
ncbi:MAG: homoserine kinase [Cytophagaceae bacterium]